MINKIRRQKPLPKSESSGHPSFNQFLSKKSGPRLDLADPSDQKQHFFLGFHDRLQRIDVKLSHNPDKVPLSNFEQAELLNEEELLTSKASMFIESLSSHNMLNGSISYQKVSKTITPLATTFPMVVNNLEKIVKSIVEILGSVDSDCNGTLLEFIIALIKDTRQLIFPVFLSKVMPKLTSIIRVEDVETLDKIFTVFSYGFKLLQRKIMENLQEVYLCYYELLAHSNKYIRKFAAESFSYIVRAFRRLQIPRKLSILLDPFLNTDKYLQLPETDNKENIQTEYSSIESVLIKIKSESNNQTLTIEEILDQFYKEVIVIHKNKLVTPREVNTIVIAISQLLGEVMQGTQGNPHSKAGDFLVSLFELIFNKKELWLQIFYICRYSIILLVNYLDKDKDKVIFESMANAFKLDKLFNQSFDNQLDDLDELKLNLISILWKEWIIYNKGKNLSEWCAKQILQKLSNLLCKCSLKFSKLPYLTQKNIIQCLGILYAIKFQLCSEVYELSSPFPDRSTNNLFKHKLFELRSPRILYDFMKALSEPYNSLLKLNQIVGDHAIPQQSLEFSVVLEKQKVLYKPLYENYVKSTFALLDDPNIRDIRARLLYVLKLAQILNETVQMTRADSENFIKFLEKNNDLWKDLNNEINDSVMNKGCYLVEVCLLLDIFYKSKAQIPIDKQVLMKILKKLLTQINKETKECSHENMYNEAIHKLACTNFSFIQYSESEDYFYGIAFSRLIVLLADNSELCMSALELLVTALESQRIHFYLLESLDKLLEAIVKLKTSKKAVTHEDTLNSCFNKIKHLLKKNLCCNLRSVRLISLKIANNYFADDKGMIRLLYKFEKTDVSLDTERDKALVIKDLKLLFESGKLEEDDLQYCVNMSFGILWNRFTPLYNMAEDLFFSVLHSNNSESLFEIFLELTRQYFNISATYTTPAEIPYPDFNELYITLDDIFYKECRNLYTVEEDYIPMKMFASNLLKIFKRVVKLSPEIIEKFTILFTTFIEYEYNKFFPDLHGLFASQKPCGALTETEQLEVFRKTNVKDTLGERQKYFKRIAKNKMAGFMEVMAEAELCDQIRTETMEQLKEIALHMLANSNEKVQKNAVELLAKIKTEYVVKNLKLLEEVVKKSPSKDLFLNIDLEAIPSSYRSVWVYIIIGFVKSDTSYIIWKIS